MAHLPKGQGVIPLPPFKSWLASNIPAVYDNTMTYYEELCALLKYLQDVVVPAVNDNASALTTVSEAVEQLHNYVENYFANLDVQEEINNKLDEMAEDGTLQEIITTYIQSNVAWVFDTVADMKSATNLVDGSFARTLGFHTINDGGGATYIISDTGTANEMDVIAIDSLYATLIKPSTVTPELYGAYGDGTHDDSDCIQECLTKNTIVHMPNIYLVTKQLEYNGTIDGEGTGVLKTDTSTRFSGAFLASTTNLKVRGLKFDCKSTVAFTLDDKFNHYNIGIIANGNLEVSECEFRNLYEKFIRVYGNDAERVSIHDNFFSSDSKTNVYMSICIELSNVINDKADIDIYNNTLKGYEYTYVDRYDNDTNINACGLSMNNINVRTLNVDGNVFDHLGREGSVSGNLGLSRLTVIDCYFNVTPLHLTNNKITNCHWTALRLHCTNNAIIDSNIITAARACSETIITISDSYNSTGEAPTGCDNVVISNNVIRNYNNVFEQGIFINSYSGASIAGAGNDGFSGHVNNLTIVNNDIYFACKHFFVFDYSLKNFYFNNNRIEEDLSGVSGIGAHDLFIVDSRSVMKTATVGKSFANTNMYFKQNTIKFDGVNINFRTTDSDLTGIFELLTVWCEGNIFESTGAGYVIYSTASSNFNLINNLIKAYSGGVFNANIAWNNIVYYATSSAGIYNATDGQNNTTYTHA